MLEACVDNLESAENAIKGGAKRLELCSALTEGGLTPTPGLTKTVKMISGTVPVYTMIRIRSGDFVYTREEADAMLEDVDALKEVGADGFVFGALKQDGSVDEDVCRRVVVRAIPCPVTFHRAFDDAKTSPLKTLQKIVDLGFERILTSGRKQSVEEGLDCVKELVEYSQGRIKIMPGSGITTDNLAEVKERTGAVEFHATCKAEGLKEKDDGKLFTNKDRIITSLEVVKKMVHILNECKS